MAGSTKKRKAEVAFESMHHDEHRQNMDSTNTACFDTRSSAVHTHSVGRAAASEPMQSTKLDPNTVDATLEDYNLRSSKRTELLEELDVLLGSVPVSPAFWACCQLCEHQNLQVLIDMAKLNPIMVLGYEKSLALLPLKWSQKFRDSSLQGSATGSQRSGSSRPRPNFDRQVWVERSAAVRDLCKERDHERCTLTKRTFPQAAHIFPYSMLNRPAKSQETRASMMIPDFWKLLSIFWSNDRISRWKRSIFQDPQNPDTGVEGCFNLISLSPDAHDMWNRGLFALKPLEMTNDRTKLTVQFFWQVGRHFKLESRIDLLTEPVSSQGMNIVGDGCWLTCLESNGSSSRITSGQKFTFSTTDPERLPLPSLAVLEMQWYLQRLVALSGAAEWPSLRWKDDKPEHDPDSRLVPYTNNAPQLSFDRVYEWISPPLRSYSPIRSDTRRPVNTLADTARVVNGLVTIPCL